MISSLVGNWTLELETLTWSISASSGQVWLAGWVTNDMMLRFTYLLLKPLRKTKIKYDLKQNQKYNFLIKRI